MKFHNGKGHNFFASPHILLGYKTPDVEMDWKHSYNIHRALTKCIDFTFSVYLKERVYLESLNIDVRK